MKDVAVEAMGRGWLGFVALVAALSGPACSGGSERAAAGTATGGSTGQGGGGGGVEGAAEGGAAAAQGGAVPGGAGAGAAGAATGVGGGGGAAGSGEAGTGGEALAGAGGSGSAGAPASGECGVSATSENPWIAAEFADVAVLSGTFTTRQEVELPRVVRDATGSGAKYAFDFNEQELPEDPRVALVNVSVSGLASDDIYGGALQTKDAPGAILYLSNVYIEPNWPEWQDYDTTNYDGMVLDASAELYAEDLTVKNWNADSAADIKSQRAEFVCLRTEGDGNRTLRFWGKGPHYLVESSVNNQTGALIWMKTCADTIIRVYQSTFNGASEVPPDRVECDDDEPPVIEYLETDPRTTGEMHPMFSAR